MPRDAVAHTTLTSGVAETTPETTTITPGNGATIKAGAEGNRLLLRIQNTTAATKKVTIKAGTTNPPAVRKGLGDLVITLTEKTEQVVVLETARFAKPDGTIDVDFEAGMTGKISAIRLPKGA